MSALSLGTLRSVRRYRSASVTTRLLVGAGLLLLLLLAVAAVSATIGPVSVPLSHVASIVVAPLGLDFSPYTRTEEAVVLQLRLPRIVVGMVVGMALGVAGATMQGLFRNPMADPGVIGVSAGGALGAVVAIALGINQAFFLALPISAFVGAMAAAYVAYGIALVGGRFSMATLLLAGVAVNAFLSAIVSAILILMAANETLRSALFWLAGGLDSRSWEHVRLSAPLILGGVALVMLLARELNLLMVGDDDARALGVRVGMVRPLLIAVAALVTGVAVAVSGIIAFVGLVVPHMLRLVAGPDHRALVPLSGLGGAVFVVLADTLARTLMQPAELRVGLITAFIGAPFFVFLLIRNRREAETF